MRDARVAALSTRHSAKGGVASAAAAVEAVVAVVAAAVRVAAERGREGGGERTVAARGSV